MYTHAITYRWHTLVAILLLGPICLSPLPTGATTLPIQFVDGMWLSTDSVHQEDTVRVYVALRNAATSEITGTVTMYANDVAIGSSTVSALPGRLIETWSDWRPEHADTYELSARLHEVTIHHQSGRERSDNELTLTHDPITVTEPPPPEEDDAIVDASLTSSDTVAFRRGLEQFIPENRAHDILDQFTEQIRVTADWIDGYEQYVRERFSPEAPASEATTSTPEERAGTTTIGAMLFGPTIDWLTRNIQNAYIGIITAIRWLFQNPVLVQILILLGLLWLIYRTAKHFGDR